MARRTRIEFPGALYHVLDRGDRCELIFRDDLDREVFLKTLGQACGRTGWRVHAYVLMGNHYHLLLETPEANLVRGMHWLQSTYTGRFNRRHRLAGHLFQGRYKAVVVDPQEHSYFVTLSDYLHLNPVRAGMIGAGRRLADYRWSSYPSYVGLLPRRPAWLVVETVLGELGLRDRAGDRRRYSEHMRLRAEDAHRPAAAEEPREEAGQHGWCLGGAAFRQRMLELLDGFGDRVVAAAANQDGAVRRAHGELRAQQLVAEGLAVWQLADESLRHLPKNDPRKLALAVLVRRHTTVSNGWLAKSLHLGHVSRASRYCGESASTQPEVARLLKTLEPRARCTA